MRRSGLVCKGLTEFFSPSLQVVHPYDFEGAVVMPLDMQ